MMGFQEGWVSILSRTLVCGTVGLGYVGLPLAVEKAKAGFKTIGFDVQADKVDMVNRGENYIGDVVQEDLAALVEAGTLEATCDFSRVAECGFVAICVPTPLDAHQMPDTSYMEASAREIAPYIREGCMVVLESTTYPGTTEELILPILEEGSGLKCGEGFYLGFSPERVDPGNLVYKTKNTPKVVGAVGEEALELISAVYEAVLEGGVTRVSSPAVAEMEKILENTYRNVNIGLVNELCMLCDRMGIDVWEVIDAAKTKPYGFTAFYPGPGLGGHCIPLDPYYLSWKAREYGFHTSMIEASMTVNDGMPEWVASRAARILIPVTENLQGGTDRQERAAGVEGARQARRATELVGRERLSSVFSPAQGVDIEAIGDFLGQTDMDDLGVDAAPAGAFGQDQGVARVPVGAQNLGHEDTDSQCGNAHRLPSFRSSRTLKSRIAV